MEVDITMREVQSSRNNTQTRSILKTRTNTLNRPMQTTYQDKKSTKQSNWENESSEETEQYEIKSQLNEVLKCNRQTKDEINFKERMEVFDNRKKNALSIAMQVLANERAECTFAPKINSPSKRSFKCFLKEQQDFLEKKANHLNLVEKEFSKTPSKLNLNATAVFSMKGKGCTIFEALEKSTPRRPRSNQCTLFKCRSTKGIKTIKQARQELEAERQKKKLEKEKNKKRNSVLKQKIGREIDTLLDKHNIKGSSMTFPIFCM